MSLHQDLNSLQSREADKLSITRKINGVPFDGANDITVGGGGGGSGDATLTSIAGLTTAADKLPYFTDVDTAATTTLTAFGRSLLDDADAAAARTSLGLGNVDNTSDANKPISTATQTALNLKVTGPASATDNALVRFDGTTGKLVQNSNVVVDDSGNVTVIGTGLRFQADFSNATVANRLLFQTSTVNGGTVIGAIPNGTATSAWWSAYNSNNPDNANSIQIASTYLDARIVADKTGAASYFPMTFYTGGSERMRIDAAGNVLVNLSTPREFTGGVVTPIVQVGSTSPSASIGITRFTSAVDAPARIILARSGSDTLGTDSAVPSNASIGSVEFQGYDGSGYTVRASIRGAVEGAVGSGNIPTAIVLSTGATTLQERLRIDSSGNVGIGAAADPGVMLHVRGNVARIQGDLCLLGFSSANAVNNWYAGANVSDAVNGGFVIGQGLNIPGGTQRFVIDYNGNVGIDGNINITGTARRITGDFSNATIANRLAFQTSTVDAITSVAAIPNGSGQSAQYALYNRSDINNATLFDLLVNSAEARIRVLAIGTGSNLPLTFNVGGLERLRINPTTGNVLATSGALGYGTGAGGTVTQGSSSGKATTVTLNKPTGQITMNNAALGAGASVTFDLNNTLISINDTLIVNQAAGTTVNYTLSAVCDNNKAYITVINRSGGSLSEGIKINFAIIKGAAS